MPRDITVQLFKFDELEDDAKEKALDGFRDVNVHHDWWDYIYDDFKEFCKTIGIDVDTRKTWFSGFSSQGDGAGFTSDINFITLVEGVQSKSYLEHAPKIHEEHKSFKLDACPADRRIIDLIKRKWISISVHTEGIDRPYDTRMHFDWSREGAALVDYRMTEKQIDIIESWLEDVLSELTSLLYRMLEKEYEYQTSDEAVKETIIANEYEFTADGKQY